MRDGGARVTLHHLFNIRLSDFSQVIKTHLQVVSHGVLLCVQYMFKLFIALVNNRVVSCFREIRHERFHIFKFPNHLMNLLGASNIVN